ncbi:hypothetical protein AVR83_16930 (plasmid) [Lactiplantibacillus plantarum]|uniref:hypothetical protein n=1 Tax=Lactiplantibacillus plantarum TaxID=1590 RepID=UPI00081D27CE|nr:hypothetical protein [Lactiplantibacillus plantarum]AOB24640.1 hypothetical protein AVR83_16930 [Lactiplantibacillus plantarum]
MFLSTALKWVRNEPIYVEDATLPSKQSQLTKAFDSVYPRYTAISSLRTYNFYCLLVCSG